MNPADPADPGPVPPEVLGALGELERLTADEGGLRDVDLPVIHAALNTLVHFGLEVAASGSKSDEIAEFRLRARRVLPRIVSKVEALRSPASSGS